MTEPVRVRRLPLLLPTAALAAGIAFPVPVLESALTIAAAAVFFATFSLHAKDQGDILRTFALISAGLLAGALLAAHPLGSNPDPGAAADSAIVQRVDEVFAGRLASFVKAVMLGRTEDLDERTRWIFRETGLTHLLAISGFHIVVFSVLAWSLCRAIFGERDLGRYVSCGIVLVYVIGIGVPAAALRSALMASALFLAQARGLPGNTLNFFCGAALLSLLVYPGEIASPGFQLSYAATFGIVVWTKPLERILPRRPRMLVVPFAASLAAQAATLPIVAWHFHEVSPISFLTNVFAIPIFSAMTILFTFALAGLPFSAELSEFLYRGLLEAVEWSALLPGTAFYVPRPPKLFCAGLLLAAIGVFFSRRARTTLLVAAILSISVSISEIPPRNGIFIARDSDGHFGVLVVRPEAAWAADYGLSAREWREFLSSQRIRTLHSVFVAAPVAFSEYGIQALAADLSIRSWLAPAAWSRNPERASALAVAARSRQVQLVDSFSVLFVFRHRTVPIQFTPKNVLVDNQPLAEYRP